MARTSTCLGAPALLLLLPALAAALTQQQLEQFNRGDGHNGTVLITTDAAANSMTLMAFKPCRRRDGGHDDGHGRTAPSSPPAPAGPTADGPVVGAPDSPVGDPLSPDSTPGSTPNRLTQRRTVQEQGEQQCNESRAVSLTVLQTPEAVQAPQQPACVPRRAVIGVSLTGRPLRQSGCDSGRRGKGRGEGRDEDDSTSAVDTGRAGQRGEKRANRRHRRRSGRRSNRKRDEQEREFAQLLRTQDQLVGVALDGFPIYSANASHVSAERLVRASDLDQCGGRCGADGGYRYHALALAAASRPDGEDRRAARVVLRLGCVKGVQLDVAAPDNNDTDAAGSGHESDDGCSYRISCDADLSADSCLSGAVPVSGDSFQCVNASARVRGRDGRRGGHDEGEDESDEVNDDEEDEDDDEDGDEEEDDEEDDDREGSVIRQFRGRLGNRGRQFRRRN